MVGGTLNQEKEQEGAFEENLELNMEEVEMGDTNDLNDIDDLGLEFEGEIMDLEAVSRKDIEPYFYMRITKYLKN